MRRVLVVGGSVALRETVEIVLAGEFAVESLSEPPAGETTTADLLVVGDPTALPHGTCPVLCIGAGTEARLPLGRRRLTLGAHFDPLELLEAARTLTAVAESGVSPRSPFLAPPFLSGAGAAVAALAVANPLPLLLWGEPGCGKQRLARAIHGERGAAHLESRTAPELNATETALATAVAGGAEVTLLVTGLEGLDDRGRRRLGEIAESGHVPDADGRPVVVRLLATCGRDPRSLLRAGVLDQPLYHRLAVLSLELPPLRSRPAEIPALARAVAANLAESLGLAPPELTPACLERLSRYLWFGNLAELEAVLARTLVFAGRGPIDRDDLRFGYGVPTAPVASAAAAEPAQERPAANGAAVDMIIHELAHEFKNPMVTIKTFAHHLDHRVDHEAEQDEFARLTGEAVERMDAALENLVQYTRFDAPARQPAALGSILAAALAGVEDVVGDKQIALEVEPTAAEVHVDPEQCTYALKNLLRAISRDLCPGDRLAVRAPGGTRLSIEYPARAGRTEGALSRLVSGDAEGQDALSLGFTFARSLFARNGGRIALERSGELARVEIELPKVGDGRGEHGEAQDPGRR